MICYAIKNEEGKYLEWIEGRIYWGAIDCAYMFRSRILAEQYCTLNYPDCKVVKVEIREVEDE